MFLLAPFWLALAHANNSDTRKKVKRRETIVSHISRLERFGGDDTKFNLSVRSLNMKNLRQNEQFGAICKS